MLQFLIKISTSKYTLPIVGVLCSGLWMLFRTEGEFHQNLYGLMVSLFAVYLLTELNNRNVLLRNGSRMLGSMLIILLTAILPFHILSALHLVLVVYVLILHVLCYMVLNPSPLLTFFLYAMLSCLLLVYPQMFLFVPILWICQINTRSLTFRTFVASVIGLVVPHWLILGWKFLTYDIPTILADLTYIPEIPLPDYSLLDNVQLVQLAYIVLVLSVGIVDFYFHKNDDKSRVRTIYTTIIIQVFFTLAFILFQPQHFYLYFTILLVGAAILGGHFLALNYTRYSHIMAIIILVLSIAVLVFSSFSSQITALFI